MTRFLLLLILSGTVALTGCLHQQPPPGADEEEEEDVLRPDPAPVPEVNIETLTSRFDPSAAGAALQTAQIAENSGRRLDALASYRQAALAAPYDPSLWDNVARTAAGLGDAEETRAARFMAARAELFSISDRHYREGERTLRAYVQEASASGDASDNQIMYAETLADYYGLERARAGSYEPPPRIDIADNEIPAAVVSIGGTVLYPVSLFTIQ